MIIWLAQIGSLIGMVPLVLLDRAAPIRGSSGDEVGTNFAIAAILVLSDPLVVAGALILFSKLQPHVALVPRLPAAAQIPVALIVGDFLSYWHHRFLHSVAWLWASHIVHHQSRSIDLSTGLRNHPFGTITQVLFWSPLLLVGVDPETMLLAAAIIGTWVMLIHSRRSRLFLRRVGWTGLVLNLPSHHLLHHREERADADCNFGLLFIFWDRLFGTFCAPRRADRFGVAGVPGAAPVARLLWTEWRNQLGWKFDPVINPVGVTRAQGLAAYFAAVLLFGFAAGLGGR